MSVVRPALLYESECWSVKNSPEYKMQVGGRDAHAPIHELGLLKGQIKNNYSLGSLEVVDIKDIMREQR